MEHVYSSNKFVEHVERSYSSMRHLEILVVYNSDSSDMCGNELVIQRLELVKGDLHQRTKKEVRGNAKLQGSLERRN